MNQQLTGIHRIDSQRRVGPEYWILALPEARLEVYHGLAGDSYQSVTNHAARDKVAPLARPDAQIAVDDLLP